MLKLVTSNKAVEPKKGWIMNPEIECGLNKIQKVMQKKAQDKEAHTIFSYNPIVFRIGLLLKLQDEKVEFFYMASNGKMEKVEVDFEGYWINTPSHFLDIEEKVQDQIREIRRERKYANANNNG